MSVEEMIDVERRKQIDARWKSDVDLKLDRLVAFSDKYDRLLEILLKREEQRERFRDAIIEKTLGALILAGVMGLIALAWSGLGNEVKALVNAVKDR